jgi:hypothetical protein
MNIMNESPINQKKARNPETSARHRKEVFWQITFPLAVGGLIVLVLAVFTAFGTSAASKSQAADIALVQLIIPVLIFGTISLLMLGSMVYGLFRLLGILPYTFLRLQIFFLRVQLGVLRVNDRLVEPFLRAHSFSARGRALGRSLGRVFGVR